MFDTYLNQQNLADQLKGLIIESRSRKAAQLQAKRHAMQTLQRFERAMWHSRAFEDALAEAGQGLAFREGNFVYEGDDAWQAISAVLDNYLDRLPTPVADDPPQHVDDVATYTTEEAAAYLGKSLDTVKTYVNRLGILHGEFKGNSRRFSKRELDRFKKEVMPTLKEGRPRKFVTTP